MEEMGMSRRRPLSLVQQAAHSIVFCLLAKSVLFPKSSPVYSTKDMYNKNAKNIYHTQTKTLQCTKKKH